MYARCSITHMTVGKVFIACGTQIKSLWYKKPGKSQIYMLKSKQSWQRARAKKKQYFWFCDCAFAPPPILSSKCFPFVEVTHENKRFIEKTKAG